MEEKKKWSFVKVASIAVVLSVVSLSVIPRFTQASPESMISELIDELHLMRSQLDLYRAQHGNCLPPVDSLESFKTNMTRNVGQFGPYVEKIPTNPFNNLNTIRFDGKPAGTGEAGWRIDTRSGLFQSDDSAAHAVL
jgi:type II secretory pathway pseudopilin PulG